MFQFSRFSKSLFTFFALSAAFGCNKQKEIQVEDNQTQGTEFVGTITTVTGDPVFINIRGLICPHSECVEVRLHIEDLDSISYLADKQLLRGNLVFINPDIEDMPIIFNGVYWNGNREEVVVLFAKERVELALLTQPKGK